MSNNVVDDYGWISARAPQSCGYIAPRVLDVLRKLGTRRVLDIGAGNGVLCSEMLGAGFDVVGVEYDSQGVAVARSRYSNIPFHRFGVQDDPRELLAHEAPFDAVISTEVIEHLYSPHLLPAYAHAVLKDDGFLVVTTPYHGYLKNLALALVDHWDKHHTALWHGGHIKFWSRKSLSQLLSENGFVVRGFSGVGRIPYLWKSMVLVAQKSE